jgi:hypothetical protein
VNKNEIISNLYKSKLFQDCINRIEPHYLREDLKSEVIVILLEKSNEQIIDLYASEKLQCYAKNIAYNLLKFKKGNGFHKQYRTITTDVIPEQIYPELNGRVVKEIIEEPIYATLLNVKSLSGSNTFTWIHELCDTLTPYQQNILSLYMKFESFRVIERETGIPWESVYKTFNKAIAAIRKKNKIRRHEY